MTLIAALTLVSVPAITIARLRSSKPVDCVHFELLFFGKLCDPSDHLQESPGPQRPKAQKSLKKSLFRGFTKKSPKIPEKVKKHPETPKFGHFLTFSGIFGDFFADPRKDSFWDFFALSGPEGPETPVNGRLGRKENSRRLWLSEIPCWKSFRANFDAAGKFLTDFPAARNAIPAKVWALFGKDPGKRLLENWLRLRERCWIFWS